ncbi:MAG: protein tyrosine phosphatase (PTP) superfamily phosphohydrolase (DUF442 family) [Planctomycetota bacterium]|jgi:protein tyrosine phosphatase (PTP) superfamily phosphohydrolase (DUF442 family)
MKRLHWIRVSVMLSLFAACQTPPTIDVERSEQLDVLSSLEIKNASVPESGLLCAGQLTEEQFDALALIGYRNFINLRLRNEVGTGWEEKHAGTIGVTFERLPIANSNSISEENAQELARLLDAADSPVVLYCGSSNRVGALYGAKAFYVDGATPDQAMDLANRAGMTRLEPRLKELLEN